jgi:hypothetical protein
MVGSLSILRYEIELARLAEQEAKTPEIRAFWSNRAKLVERELERLFEKRTGREHEHQGNYRGS